jgi:hypothetical protein
MNSTPATQALENQPNGADLLIRLPAWVTERNLPFLITNTGMIVMLLWCRLIQNDDAGRGRNYSFGVQQPSDLVAL